MTASEYCTHCDSRRKPITRKPSSKTRDERYLYGRLLGYNKTQMYLQKYFPKQITEYQKCEQNRSPEEEKRRVGTRGTELQG